MLTPSLMHHLSIVPDFRQAWKVQHQLSDILFLTVCAVICGAEGWDEIEDFGHAKLDFLRQYGDFEAGVPSHDTLARVMALVNAEQLQSAFAEWMKACHDVTPPYSRRYRIARYDPMACRLRLPPAAVVA